MQIASVLPPALQPAPFVQGGSALIFCRIGPVTMKEGFALVSWDREDRRGKKHRETGRLG